MDEPARRTGAHRATHDDLLLTSGGAVGNEGGLLGAEPVDVGAALFALHDPQHIARLRQHAFGKQQPDREFAIVARRPHRDRNRLAVAIVSRPKPDANIERLLDRKAIVLRQRAFADDLDNLRVERPD